MPENVLDEVVISSEDIASAVDATVVRLTPSQAKLILDMMEHPAMTVRFVAYEQIRIAAGAQVDTVGHDHAAENDNLTV